MNGSQFKLSFDTNHNNHNLLEIVFSMEGNENVRFTNFGFVANP